jgi:hypothetical protein
MLAGKQNQAPETNKRECEEGDDGIWAFVVYFFGG